MSPGQSTLQESSSPIALNAEAGQAPEWVMLLAAGPKVQGIDGRSWANPDPHAVVAGTMALNRPLVMDWEHATKVRGDQGLDAPAAGWIDKVEVRDGAIWGHVDWTPRGRDQVANREYRFLSPAFRADAKPPHVIRHLTMAGLTNAPNLHLAALNRTEAPHPETSENHLDLAPRLRAALGLAADATEDVIVTAATTNLAMCRSGPDLTAFAPRADLETALNRATTAEAALAARTTADQAAGIETALNKAQAEGKITPASRPAYEAMCKAEGGLANFTALAATLPKITGAEAVVDKKPGDATGAAGLTETELAMCRATGTDPVEFAKLKQEEA